MKLLKIIIIYIFKLFSLYKLNMSDKVVIVKGILNTIIRLVPVKLCIEIELLFRYLDYEYHYLKIQYYQILLN